MLVGGHHPFEPLNKNKYRVGVLEKEHVVTMESQDPQQFIKSMTQLNVYAQIHSSKTKS